jgi:hypothetical protein
MFTGAHGVVAVDRHILVMDHYKQRERPVLLFLLWRDSVESKWMSICLALL